MQRACGTCCISFLRLVVLSLGARVEAVVCLKCVRMSGQPSVRLHVHMNSFDDWMDGWLVGWLHLMVGTHAANHWLVMMCDANVGYVDVAMVGG